MLNNIYTVFNCYTGTIYIHTRFKTLAKLFTWFNGHDGTDWDLRENVYFEETEVLEKACHYWYEKQDLAYAATLAQELTTRPDFKKAINKKRATFQRKLKRQKAKGQKWALN